MKHKICHFFTSFVWQNLWNSAHILHFSLCEITRSVSVHLFMILSVMPGLELYCRQSGFPCPDPAAQQWCKMQRDSFYYKKPFSAQADIFQSITLSGWATSSSFLCCRGTGRIPLGHFAWCWLLPFCGHFSTCSVKFPSWVAPSGFMGVPEGCQPDPVLLCPDPCFHQEIRGGGGGFCRVALLHHRP